jgi:hypothetical protein
MYSRSAKGGEKGDPNRNPWLAKMETRQSADHYVFIITSQLSYFNIKVVVK